MRPRTPFSRGKLLRQQITHFLSRSRETPHGQITAYADEVLFRWCRHRGQVSPWRPALGRPNLSLGRDLPRSPRASLDSTARTAASPVSSVDAGPRRVLCSCRPRASSSSSAGSPASTAPSTGTRSSIKSPTSSPSPQPATPPPPPPSQPFLVDRHAIAKNANRPRKSLPPDNHELSIPAEKDSSRSNPSL